MEFEVQVECPHCGAWKEEHVDFDPDCGDRSGVKSNVREGQCYNFKCDKKFWFTAYLSFETEMMDSFTEEPKPKKAGK